MSIGTVDVGAYEEQALNQAPVARCKDVTVVSCDPAGASFDDGSFDPDDNPITVSQSPPGPYPIGANTPIEQGTGERPVARPDLENAFPPHLLKVRYPLYSVRIDEEVLVVLRRPLRDDPIGFPSNRISDLWHVEIPDVRRDRAFWRAPRERWTGEIDRVVWH